MKITLQKMPTVLNLNKLMICYKVDSLKIALNLKLTNY